MPPTELKLFLSYLTLHTEKWTDCISPFFHLHPTNPPYIDPSIHLSICPFVLSYITLYTEDFMTIFLPFSFCLFSSYPSFIHSTTHICFSLLPSYTKEWAYICVHLSNIWSFFLSIHSYMNSSIHPHFTSLLCQTINEEIHILHFHFCLFVLL